MAMVTLMATMATTTKTTMAMVMTTTTAVIKACVEGILNLQQ
jgi:hypothetical protein